jgi:hypothetical protein
VSGARFSHVDDDMTWQEVRQIRQADGRTASVWEKWFQFSDRYLALYAKWDPGMMIHAHGHNSDHVIFVVAGEMTCGDVRCTPGTHIALDQGDTFGPFVAGPEGVELYEVMMGDPRSFPADPEGWVKLLADKGAEQMPNPPIDMPSFFPDARSGPPETPGTGSGSPA